jgi:hypothetical protein
MVDLVIRVQPIAYEATFAELTADMKYVVEKLMYRRAMSQESVPNTERSLEREI